MIRVASILLLCVAELGASLPQDPTEEQILRHEPQLYFLLGISDRKLPETWEFFYPYESETAAVYDQAAYSLATDLGFTDGSTGASDAKKEARWKARFAAFLDRYYSHYYTEWGDSGLVLDVQRLLSEVRRSPSLDAYLAGAYLRHGKGGHIHLKNPAKVQSVAVLLNRRINTGVITHTYFGYTPGGTDVEFKETSVLRKIFDSWKRFAEAPRDAEVSRSRGGSIAAEYVVVLKKRDIGGTAAEELPKALSYELDRTEQGSVVSESSDTDAIEVEMAVFDAQEGLAAIRRVLTEYAVPPNSRIGQTSPTQMKLPVYLQGEPNKAVVPTPGSTTPSGNAP